MVWECGLKNVTLDDDSDGALIFIYLFIYLVLGWAKLSREIFKVDILWGKTVFGCTQEHIKPPVINFSFVVCGKGWNCCILWLVACVVTYERLKRMLYDLYHVVSKEIYCEMIIKELNLSLSHLKCFIHPLLMVQIYNDIFIMLLLLFIWKYL